MWPSFTGANIAAGDHPVIPFRMPVRSIQRFRLGAMVGLAAFAALAGGCSNATTNSASTAGYHVGFASATTPPTAPTSGTALTFTMSVSDVSASGVAAANVPFTVTVDGAAALSATIVSIPANTTVQQQFTLNQQTAGTHTIVITIDPGNTTGAAGEGDDAQTLTITVAQAVNN
jgi:archaellum component FlaG (FlaF/FlaG flagellin family)